MSVLRRLIDKQHEILHRPGSKLNKLWPAFDAFETFLLNPDHRTKRTGPHVRDYADLKRVMWTVIVALVPCLLCSIWNTGAQHFLAIAEMAAKKGAGFEYHAGWLQGWLGSEDLAQAASQPGFVAPAWDKIVFGLQQLLPLIVVSYVVGLGIEMLFSVIRNEEVSEGYLVSGLLIPLIVPPSLPLWQLAVGVAFAVVLGKEVFGGTGMNIFNPALLCRAFLFFAFPAQISGDSVWVAGNDKGGLVDGFTQATPLAVVKPEAVADASTQLAQHYSAMDLFLGNIPGSAGEVSKLMVLLGAFWLVFTGVGSWRVMLGGVLGLLGTATVMHFALPSHGGTMSLMPWEQLLCGGFLFGIVFMATDPVSSPETNTGKWIYGLLIGFVTILVRTINQAYPEGTMLAILLLNAFAPGIDHFVVTANIRQRMARQ
ncbi:MAG: NADH:ubiquinone reductase (Na(+)-transporting) subunit B [Planctomycetota bacterium]